MDSFCVAAKVSYVFFVRSFGCALFIYGKVHSLTLKCQKSIFGIRG